MVVHTFRVSFFVQRFNFGIDVATALCVMFLRGSVIIYFTIVENDSQFLQV